MANREALNQLQERLAQRLLTAQTEGVALSWLALRSASGHYLVELGLAGEICPVAALQSVPHTRAWFLGVQNVRGNVLGVVDLAAFLGQGRAASSGQGALEHCVVTLSPKLEVNCGLLVDALLGLRSASDFQQVEAPPADAPAYLGPQRIDAAGLRWQELDLRALAQAASFLHISL